MPRRSKETNIIQQTLGQVIRSLRYNLDLTQDQLAERAGMDRTYIGDLELGGRNIALRSFLRLSMALEISPDKLMRRLLMELGKNHKGFDLKAYLEKSKWTERG